MSDYKVFSDSRSFNELKEEVKTKTIRPVDLTLEDFFQLWVIENKSDKEIAKLIGATEKTVSNRRQKLRVIIPVRDWYKLKGPLFAVELLNDLRLLSQLN